MIEEPIPEYFYKYTKLDQNFYNLLITNMLWFSAAKDFNDPFDCNFIYEKEFKDDDIDYFHRNIVTGERNEDVISKTIRMWQSDHRLVIEGLIKPLREMFLSKGLSCFSEDGQNLLMWAHYGNQHKGVCIKFSYQELSKSFNGIRKVVYDEKFPEINPLRSINDVFSIITLQKSNHWAYEKEIRIMHKAKGLYPFSKLAIKEIIFGLKTPDSDVITIMVLMESLGYKDVVFKKSFLNSEGYKLDYNFLKLNDPEK